MRSEKAFRSDLCAGVVETEPRRFKEIWRDFSNDDCFVWVVTEDGFEVVHVSHRYGLGDGVLTDGQAIVPIDRFGLIGEDSLNEFGEPFVLLKLELFQRNVEFDGTFAQQNIEQSE